MGELIHLTCTGCDVDRQDYLGSGMSGQLRTLCACDHCRRVVIDEGKWTSPHMARPTSSHRSADGPCSMPRLQA